MSKSRRGRPKKCLELTKTVNIIELELSEKNFIKGEHVYYIPPHLMNTELYLTHPQVESGIVSSMNNQYVFVRFFEMDEEKGLIGLQATGKACSRDNLFPMSIRDIIPY